jgi:hypothetical protein
MQAQVPSVIVDGIALVQRFAVPLAIAVGAYWLVHLVRRVRSNDDPSLRKTTSSGTGSMMVMLSGAYFSAALAGMIVFLTWPAPVESPGLGLLLVGGVTFHAVLEKREDMGATA